MVEPHPIDRPAGSGARAARRLRWLRGFAEGHVRQVHWRDDAEALTALLRLAAVPVLVIGDRYVPKPEPSERLVSSLRVAMFTTPGRTAFTSGASEVGG